MKSEIVFTSLLVSVFAICLFTSGGNVRADSEEEELKNLAEYLKKFEHIDVKEVLDNDRLFLSYFNCFMETGACTPEAKSLRRALPIIQDTACEKCTEDQKKNISKVLHYMKDKRTQQWNDVIAKYKPDEKLIEKFLKDY